MSEVAIQSPPPTARPIDADPPDARARLTQLGQLLAKARSAALLAEYLRLRASIRPR